MIECVKGLNIFEVLSEESVKEIASKARVIKLEAGSILFRPEDTVEFIYILHQGKIKIYKLNEAGRQLTLAHLVPGNIIGEVDLFSMRPRGVFAEVVQDAVLCVIDNDYIREILLKYPELTEKMLNILCSKIKELENEVYDQAICSTRGRIIKKLLQLADSHHKDSEESILIPITHQELADIIGSSRETVSLTLKTLDNSGYLETLHGKVRFEKNKLLELKNSTC